MGKSPSNRPRKRKFHGNQNTCTETASCKEEIMTASSLKLQQCNQVNNDEINISEHLTRSRLIDLEILIGIFALLCCPTKKCTAGSLLVEDSRFGLSSNFTLHCKNYSFISAFCTSKTLDKMNELNTSFAYGLRLIGRGVSAGRKLCAVLNLSLYLPFFSKLAFRQQEKKLLSAATSIGEKIMNDAGKDGLETARNFIHDESWDIMERFDLAWNYCFEDDVQVLWRNMTISYWRSTFIQLPRERNVRIWLDILHRTKSYLLTSFVVEVIMTINFSPPLQLIAYARIAQGILYTFDLERLYGFKTARMFIRDEDFDAGERFHLAFEYSFADDVQMLRNKNMSVDERSYEVRRLT
ncbi:uncharacterized protein TNIN_354451 [Trichonephila inaurata madagascariensis]|uniref:Mutator-like transposase domain-containing protein n=1 Tax=Trichonephila inaurata madagascariensis TaxID=2747483 RepID=A0A8X7BRA2_9ARAC|nr:uncharacterized protein TNIN_354451 [Trichonephila inaurata madagascariensis]